jgi:hypothetical protein
MKRFGLGLVLVSACAVAACGPPSVRPLSFPDPSVPCPAGLVSWKLEVLDRRAGAEGAEKMIAAIRDGIEKSFPGCRWSGNDGASTITITVHRFEVEEHDRYEDAGAEWTVNASSAGGSTMTEFDANEEDTRPAYSGADTEALNEVFRKALDRTVKGLAAMPRSGSMRPPKGTSQAGFARATPDAPNRLTR